MRSGWIGRIDCGIVKNVAVGSGVPSSGDFDAGVQRMRRVRVSVGIGGLEFACCGSGGSARFGESGFEL